MEHSSVSLFLYVSGLLLAAAPWLIGAALAVAGTRRADPTLSSYTLAAGVGGYVGYLLCVPFTWFLGAEIQLWWVALVLIQAYVVVALVAFALIKLGVRVVRSYRLGDTSGANHESCSIVACFSTLLALLVFAVLYQTTNMPTQAWDVLDFWARVSADFLLYSLHLPDVGFQYAHRHPPTAALVAAWAPLTGSLMQLPIYPYLPWFLLWLSLGLVVYGFARLLGHNGSLAILITCGSMTIPLLEMHVNGPGYAELLILISVVSSSAVIALSVYPFNWRLMFIGILLAVSVLFTKNIALFYFSVLILPAVFVLIGEFSPTIRRIIGICVFALGVLVWWAWRNQLSISIAGNLVGFDWREGFLFGGWFLSLVQPSFGDVAAILLQAWLFNLSFGISISLFGVLAYYSFFMNIGSPCRMTNYLLLCFFFGICGAVISFFTDYGLRYAMPGSDTGNSRFSLPLVPILFLAISSVLRMEGTKVSKISNNNMTL